MTAMLFIEVEPEQEPTPFVEDPDTDPRQQGKQPPPFDHVDKNLIPSLSRLCMIRMITLSILPHSLNPYPLHGLSFYHSSKLTTILADIGGFCDHVAPANVI